MTKDESIAFLRERSIRSIEDFFEMADHLAQKLDEDTPKEEFDEICREGAGVTGKTGAIWANIARDEDVRLRYKKIIAPSPTALKAFHRLKPFPKKELMKKLDAAIEPIPMTEQDVLAHAKSCKKGKTRQTLKSPFMDSLDFDARVARFKQQLGDDRMMKANPKYQKHFDRIGEAKTLVGSLVDPIFEELLLLLTRADNREHLTMANGMLIHNNDLERDLHLAPTVYSKLESAGGQPDPKPPEDSEDEETRKMFERLEREDEEPRTPQPEASQTVTVVLPAPQLHHRKRGQNDLEKEV